MSPGRGGRIGLCALALVWCGGAEADERRNFFDDPFIQVSHGLPACPVPAGPQFSAAEAKAEEHARSQRGVSCYMAGRCRLPNAYLYDREIVPRVERAIHADSRFERTSIWAYGQRRWVWLQGCVNSEAESQELERLIRNIDDVEAVINELSIGVGATPRYEVAR
ncbi:MAG TPA: BON domain-containing protein [Burkholderiaceae bacterium]|nr:BON domain-containing protein [Burkholderiaceae bacterium]